MGYKNNVYSVFFSYAKTDSSNALNLVTELKKGGARVWIDQLDILPGKIWDLEIEKAIDECECLLVMLTPAAISSENVLNEVYYALDNNKRVLPIIMEKCKIPFRIARLHYIDFTVNDFQAAFNRLLDTINPIVKVDVIIATELTIEDKKP